MPAWKARRLLAMAAVVVGVTPLAGHADNTSTPVPLADSTVAAFSSPYVFTPEAQLVGQPEWQRSFQQGLDRAKLVGYKWMFFSLQWSYLQLPDGSVDFSGLDSIVKAAHDDQIQLVIDLQSCNFSEPQSPTLTGGGYRLKGAGLPTCAPKDFGPLVNTWTAVFDRYRPGGGLATTLGWNDGYGVLNYEIENEPNSLVWTTGNYQKIPKDYALFVSLLGAAAHNLDPRITFLAPALSQDSGSPPAGQDPPGIAWLKSILDSSDASMAGASDDYTAAWQAGQAPVVGAGPYIGAYSYHEDFANAGTSVLEVRPIQIHDAVTQFANQAKDPTTTSPMLWCTECGSGYVSSKTDPAAQLAFSYGEAQYMLETIGAGAANGVAHMAVDFSVNNMDDDATFEAEPGYLMAKAFTTYFPTKDGWSDLSQQLSDPTDPSKAVVAFSWADPQGANRATALFAPDIPNSGDANTPTVAPSSTVGPDFTVQVPVSTPTALVIDNGWHTRTVTATNGFVTVTLHQAQPSPVVMVVEQP
jgi:hypothetical protein